MILKGDLQDKKERYESANKTSSKQKVAETRQLTWVVVMVFLNLKLSQENEHTDHHYSGELLNLWVAENNSAQSEEEENDEWVRFEENVLCVLEVVPFYLVSAHVVRLNEGEEICEGKDVLEKGEEIF